MLDSDKSNRQKHKAEKREEVDISEKVAGKGLGEENM